MMQEHLEQTSPGVIKPGHKALSHEAAPFFEITMEEGQGDDLTILPEASHKALAEVLSRRYAQDRIYTSIGPVLVALNPYKPITAGNQSIYDDSVAWYYYEHSPLEVAPHVYKIGSEAYKDLMSRNRSQCVVISGESGAGKTETTKACMRLLTTVTEHTEDPSASVPLATGAGDLTVPSSSRMHDVRRRLLQSNPVLEAFGNAQTIRNDNSSRFGKYQQIMFDFKGAVVGGRVTKYLLEKSRVVQQSQGERNFHVFYQLLAGASAEQRERLRLRRVADGGYAYLQGEQRCISGVDDAAAFVRLQQSMTGVGMSEEEQEQVFRLLSATLMLGEVEFEDHGLDQRATISTPDALNDVSSLLEVCPEGLEWAFTTSLLGSATKTKSVQRRVKDRKAAIFMRDTLAKEIYKRIFDFVILKVNQGMEYDGAHKTIGLLDIYGFEIFDKNGFEQFNINYVNEKLQQAFLTLTLQAEQQEYETEGLDWTRVEFFDNKIVLEALDKKSTGVYDVLDMQCTFKEATYENLLLSLSAATASNPYFMTPQQLVKNKIAAGANTFGIRHYAGDVVYTVDAFIDKNRDTLTQDLLTVMEMSECPLLAQIMFRDDRSEQEKAKRPPTIGMQFRKQVEELLQSLKTCQQHYIRCIKPNDEKKPGIVDMQRVVHQCQYLGLRENVLVRQSGFCYRGRFLDFLKRYSFLCAESWEARTHKDAQAEDPTEALRVLLTRGTPKAWGPKAVEAVAPFRFKEGQDYVLGKSMIFIRDAKTLHSLEAPRARLLPYLAIRLQARVRAFLQRKRFVAAVHMITVAEAQARRVINVLRFKRLKVAALEVQTRVRGFLAVRHIKAMRKQFKNRPPRVWAKQLQRTYRGHAARGKLDKPTLEKTRAIGVKLQEMRRRQRASTKLGAWYRTRHQQRRYQATKRKAITLQALIRVLLAKRAKDKQLQADVGESRQELEKGARLDKFYASGSKLHTKEVKLVDGHLVWVSPPWKPKKGINLAHITEVHRGRHMSSGKKAGDECCVSVRDASGLYTFKAPSEHQRDRLYRFLRHCMDKK